MLVIIITNLALVLQTQNHIPYSCELPIMFRLKQSALLLSLLSCTTFADQTTYQSIVNQLVVNADGKVDITVLLLKEEDEISCSSANYDFRFDIEPIVGQRWYDTLILSRNTNSLVNFHYDEDSCILSAISLPKLYENGSSVGGETPEGQLKETGANGNVALIGTNGLSAESYSASDFYGQDAPAAAFDGYVYSNKANNDADEKISRGIWMAKNIDSDGEPIKPWIQVDFGKEVILSSIQIVLNKQSVELGRSPRNMALHTSIDGETFEEEAEFFLALGEKSGGDFATPIKSRFFRFEVLNNYGDKKFIEIDELELFQ